MTANSDTEAARDHVTVARHSPSQSRWAAQEAALEFGRFQMLLRRRQLIAGGVPVKLGTRAFDHLLVLLKADGSLANSRRCLGSWLSVRIIKSNGEPVEVDYVMRQNGESWLIADIYLDSAISEVAPADRNLPPSSKTQGIDGVIAALNRKADILTGTTARSF